MKPQYLTVGMLATIAMLVLLMGAGCSDRHSRYSDFVRIDSEGWAYGDTVKVRPTRLDSVDMRRLAVAVRHDNDYPYRNLWLEVSYHTGHSTVRDTIELMLADIYGRWLGRGFGPSYQLSQPLQARFRIPDSTEISLRHIMRCDTLRGIEQVGIEVVSAP